MSWLAETTETLARCTTLEEVKIAFRSAIAGHGFTASACGCFVPTRSGPLPMFYFQDWPDAWMALYRRENFVAHDYGVAEARRRIAPFTWSEVKQTRQLSVEERRVWQAVQDFGWRDGYSVPVHGPGGYFGLVTMASRSAAVPAAMLQALHLVAFAAHERCRAISGEQRVASQPERLTARELECLRWVTAGLSDGQIARILAISATTVKFHVDAGRRKLGAKTRAHASALLVLHGLI